MTSCLSRPGHDGEGEVRGPRRAQNHPQRLRRQDQGTVDTALRRSRHLRQEVVSVTAAQRLPNQLQIADIWNV